MKILNCDFHISERSRRQNGHKPQSSNVDIDLVAVKTLQDFSLALI